MARRQDRTLSVNIVGDVRDLKRSLSQVEASTRSTSQKLGQVGGIIKGAFSVAAINEVAQFIEKLRDVNIETEAIGNRFQQVFGSQATDVAQWADDVNERFGVSVERVQDLANGVGDLLVPLGFTREETAGLTQETLQLANALSEWSGGNIDVVDSTERIRKALLGERESLEALGVKVLQSDVNARLAAEGNDKLAGAQKARAEAQATLAIITEKSADALKAYADGTNEALIQQKALRAAQEDSAQALAQTLNPEIETLTDIAEGATLAGAGLIEMLQELAGQSDETEESQQSLIRGGLDLIEKYGPDGLGNILTGAVNRWLEYRDAQDQVTESTEGASAAANTYEARLSALGREAEDAKGGIEGTAQAIKDLQAAERAAVDPVFALRTANEKLNEAFEKRVSLQAEEANQGQINDAIQAELDAAQDLEFARQNLNDAGDEGLSILERYAEQYALGADAIRAYKDEVLGLRDALNGLPNQITLPTISGGGASIRQLEEDLNRRGRATVE